MHKGQHMTEAAKDNLRRLRRGAKASAETRAKMAAAKIGHIVSPETRERQRQSNLITWKNPALLVQHRQRRAKQAPPRCPFTRTRPENRMVTFLEEAGFSVIREKRFGNYRVDAYLPEYHLAFEADGTFWHQLTEKRRPGYYENRDKVLRERFQLPVVRLTDKEILAWPS